MLAVSGLDEFGRIIQGDNEIYDPETKQWEDQPQLKRTFPTYPSLFLMPSGKLFYTGSNAGYGSDTRGPRPRHLGPERQHVRQGPGPARPAPDRDQRERPAAAGPGPALHDRRRRRASASPSKSTARTDVIDLDAANPRFTPGPDLDEPARYPNMVITPDDKVVITGGSRGYRGEGDSDALLCHLYDPQGERLDARGRPDGRAQLPRRGAAAARRPRDHARQRPALRATPTTRKPGTFEKRIEIYSPPYLYQGDRPGDHRRAGRRSSAARRARFGTPDAGGDHEPRG